MQECPACSVSSPLWTRPELRAATGDTLRPGGLTLTDIAAEALELVPGMTVLDAGCGPGATVRHLRKRYGVRAVGIDLYPGPAPGLPLLRGPIDTLPFATKSLNAVFCECVLSLQPDPEQVLTEYFRVLKSGGGLVLSDLYLPTASTFQQRTAFARQSCAHGAHSRTELFQWLHSVGFQCIHFEDHSPLLRDLAAQLAWNDISPSHCRNGQCTGYYLLLARKPEVDHV